MDTEILASEIRDPQVIRNYYVYQYMHLDYLDFCVDATKMLENVLNKLDIITEIKNLFLSAGWEGDGEIELIWFPPFLDVGVEDTSGFCVWHVKQANNGTSWLASPVELNFQRLRNQN